MSKPEAGQTHRGGEEEVRKCDSYIILLRATERGSGRREFGLSKMKGVGGTEEEKERKTEYILSPLWWWYEGKEILFGMNRKKGTEKGKSLWAGSKLCSVLFHSVEVRMRNIYYLPS